MKKIQNFLKKIQSKVGPGFVTGAADDDPSGVATYSIAGAQFGYNLSWLSLFLLPAMITIQEMCARIGLMSGRGLAGAIKTVYSKKILYFAVSLLAFANTINIGADLGIIAATLQMVTGINFFILLIIVSFLIILLEIFEPYKRYSKLLKFLSFSLLVYVVTALLVKQNWLLILKSVLIPHISFNTAYLMAMVGFFGTTISPYLFFWQPGEEIEEEIESGKISDFNQKPFVSTKNILDMRADTRLGMGFSSLMAFFIVLTTAATLHANGITIIESPEQVALALKPLAGNFAFLLFTVGIIGIGFQAIPVLAGSLSYAVSETFGFKEGLFRNFKKAKPFYLIIALSTIFGALLNILGVNTIKALYFAAIINGVVSIPLIAIIIRLSVNEKIVGRFKSSKKSILIAYITFIFMFLASSFMLIRFFVK